MLQHLERSDWLAELLALLRIGNGVLQQFVEQARCGQRQVLTLDGVELLRQLADAPRTVVLREGAQPSLRALCFAVDLVAPKLLQLLGKIFS